jgi:hypothetical protein
MLPLLLLCNPISTIEFNIPQMEFITNSITSIQNKGKLMAFDAEDFFYSNKTEQLIGTTIVSETLKGNFLRKESDVDFLLEDFDLSVKLSVNKRFTKKIKIKSISKHIPKMSI